MIEIKSGQYGEIEIIHTTYFPCDVADKMVSNLNNNIGKIEKAIRDIAEGDSKDNITFGDIMLKFKSMFPAYISGMSDYRPQDGQSYSIHIWMKDGRELVFMYKNDNDWLFETNEHFKMRTTNQ